MKLKLIRLTIVTLLALSASTIVTADDSRYIIQIDDANKGIIKALTVNQGGTINLDAKGFIAATFAGKSLAQVKGLLNNPNIKLIEEDFRRYPTSLYNDDLGDPNTQQVTPYAIKQSEAGQLTLGSDQKVCIIDSGLDNNNDDFNWGAITGDNDSGTGNWNVAGGPHGTHVAGTVGAANNDFGVIGMAPGVPMHIIKVFNDDGWGYSSGLAQAADLCTQAGANIITMSLGGGGANSTEENAFISFTDNGGLVLAAAGNAGNTARSYPAGYISVMMIGANDANNDIADFSQHPKNSITIGRGKNRTTDTNDGYGVEVTAGGVNVLSTYPAGAATLSTIAAGATSYPSSAMENTGSASGNTYFMGTAEATNAGANGQICVIDRGNISFHNKVANCENSGGIGAIIINNVAGMLYGTLGDTNTTTIPAVGTAFEDRTSLVAASTASISVGTSDYGYMSGTSMSTPTAAGVAALIWSNNPNCTGTEVRQAMKDSAEDQGESGRDDYFGYGIIKALAANTLLAASSCGSSSSGNVSPNASFTINCILLDCNFNASASSDLDGSITTYSWEFDNGNTDLGVTASKSYDTNGSYTITLTVTDNEGATGSTSQTITVSDGAEPPPANIALNGTRLSNGRSITLNWSGATGTNVDIHVNGSLNNTTANDGSITYRVNKNGSYTFKVCEEGSTTACSNDLTL